MIGRRAEPSLDKVNILLVDDRAEGLISLESVLDRPEYNLVKVHSGQEALAQVFSNDFAVILMDVQMPDMDGFETATIIKQRERSKNIPIIFMTANNIAEQNIIKGYMIGAVDYVLKPFDAQILKSKVAVFVELYKKNLLIQEQAWALQIGERRERMRILHDLENEGRRRYQNLADALPQILFKTNDQQKIEYFNQYWAKYTGDDNLIQPDESWRRSILSEDLDKFENGLELAHHSQKGFEIELRIRQFDGEYRWHILRVTPEIDSQLALANWIGIATDIHDQKKNHEELILAKKQAEVANETKSNFLANMSHEIRTPLGIILGFSELLIDPKVSYEEKKKMISSIKRSGVQLSRIIDDILDLSKVEAGKMNMELSEVQPIEFLSTLKSFFIMAAKQKGLNLQFDINGQIPSKIIVCSTRLHQILVNLIGNAIKFSERGTVTVSTMTKKENNKNILQINVTDSGTGLTQEQIKNLFQPFTQLDTSMTRKHGGTGLGLALSQKFASAMGGEITATPNPQGNGSTFSLKIPVMFPDEILAEDQEFVEQPIEKSTNYEESQSLKNMKILLVEDSLDNQELFSLFLSMAGAEITLANNGVEGVQKAMDGNYDLILMDIQMPILDGYGAIKKLRTAGYKKPIIALTAHGMLEDRRKCIELGSNGHLTKPVDRNSLIEKVQSFLEEV